MINIYFKQLKKNLALKIRKINFPKALKFSKYQVFLDLLFFNFLNFDKFLIISSILLLSSQPSLLLSVFNTFIADYLNNLVIFNIKTNFVSI